MEEKIRAALYVRVSTASKTKQADTAKFIQNPDVQEQPIRDLVAQRGWTIYRVFSDRASGARERRPGLDALMADARRGMFDVVVVWRFDRFARSVKQLVLTLEEFKSLGIEFVSHQEALDTSTPMGKAMFTIVAAIAELERSLIRERSVNLGVAAHISGAAVGGPRYDATITPAQRASIKNGVWLCQTCAKRIDADEQRYTVAVLASWKKGVENEAHQRLGKAKARPSTSSTERELKRTLQLRDEMRRDFLKGATYRPGAIVHPYDKFRLTEAIVHRLGDDTYPEVEDRPGISPWFKEELFDFYHNGIKVILGIESGIVGNGPYYVGNQNWATIPFQSEFDRSRFREVGIWKLGLIPFRNIRHYDLKGDEFYSTHIYCEFSIDGKPYEGFEYAVVGKDEYDWPLKLELRLPTEMVAATASNE